MTGRAAVHGRGGLGEAHAVPPQQQRGMMGGRMDVRGGEQWVAEYIDGYNGHNTPK